MSLHRIVMLCAFVVAFAAPLAVARPNSAAALSRLTITLKCTTNPERTTIRNNTTATVKIKTIGSLYQPLSSEPFTVNFYLGAGNTVTFQSGTNTTGHTLTHQFIYSNTATTEGARIVTNIDTFTKKCGNTGGSSGGSGGSSSSSSGG